MIIDSGSCENIISTSLIKALELKIEKHVNPYKTGWIKKNIEMMVNEACTIQLSTLIHFAGKKRRLLWFQSETKSLNPYRDKKDKSPNSERKGI